MLKAKPRVFTFFKRGLLCLVIILLILFLAINILSYRYYIAISTSGSTWKRTFCANESRGMAVLPNTHGQYSFYKGEYHSIATNYLGFRVKENEHNDKPKVSLMSAGCSFTFGAEMDVAGTFSSLVADSLGSHLQNGGSPGYGYAQMMLTVDKALENERPEYLLIQVSPWLAQRAGDEFMPNVPLLKIPSPYVSCSSGQICLQPPLWRAAFIDTANTSWFDNCKDSSVSFKEFLKFNERFFLPAIFNQLVNQVKQIAKKINGQYAYPCSNMAAIEKFSWIHIANACKSTNTKPVFVIVGYNSLKEASDVQKRIQEIFLEGVTVANADSVLWSQSGINFSRNNYNRAYCFWRGNPSVMVDQHLNEKAHSLIAGAILNAMKKRVTSSH